MNKNNIEKVYSEKYNQFYKPIRFDDNGICEVILSKKDKTTKNHIASFENDKNWKFVIMQNEHIRADEYFVNTLNGDNNKSKMRVLQKFFAHGLCDSELAMNELARWFKIGYTDTVSDEDKKVRALIQKTYIKMCTHDSKKIKDDRYTQHIPQEIKYLGYEKGLIIERSDDYYTGYNGVTTLATGKLKEGLKAARKCGYRIVNMSGKVIAGQGFSFVDAQVVDFVKRYNSKPEDLKGDYMVALSKNQQTKLKKLSKFLESHNLRIKNKNNLRFWVTNTNGKVIGGGIVGLPYNRLHAFVRSLAKKRGWA